MGKNGEIPLIRPKFLALPEKPESMSRDELEDYIRRRKNDKGKNTAIFYEALYDVLRTDPRWRGRRLKVRNPEEYGVFADSPLPLNHSSDSLKLYGSGPVYGEVKTTALRHSEGWCSPKQLARYWLRMEARIEEGDKIPGIQYGLFRYGTHDDYDMHKCDRYGKRVNKKRHICDDRCLTRNLTKKTRDLTVIPLNLLIALFMSDKFGRAVIVNQTNSRQGESSVPYFRLFGSTCSYFHGNPRTKPVESVEELLGDSISPATYGVLCLRDMNIVREQSGPVHCLPESFSGNPYLIPNFPVVRVEMTRTNEEKWIENFRRYGRELLQHSLHLMDLESVAAELIGFDEIEEFVPIKRYDEVPF
ncbi:hypothetical protein GF386_06540 [Candidatus Pacearchaeota archaeon]|nr:hypothetical protein [Candidatus Pacearchaeota archaeon]MBD3283750.1 hypothetical protein [Candidatus Pacearchaeota archaeon]